MWRKFLCLSCSCSIEAEFSKTHQLFPFLMDFHVVMAILFEIPVFFTHPVYFGYYKDKYQNEAR